MTNPYSDVSLLLFPLYFCRGRNDSLPPAWFEIDDSGGKLRSEHKGLLQLIQHKAEGSEDSSFNTTFGMITMFR